MIKITIKNKKSSSLINLKAILNLYKALLYLVNLNALKTLKTLKRLNAWSERHRVLASWAGRLFLTGVRSAKAALHTGTFSPLHAHNVGPVGPGHHSLWRKAQIPFAPRRWLAPRKAHRGRTSPLESLRAPCPKVGRSLRRCLRAPCPKVGRSSRRWSHGHKTQWCSRQQRLPVPLPFAADVQQLSSYSSSSYDEVH